MKRAGSLLLLTTGLALALGIPAARAAGKYSLAYWRELGAYSNQSPPAGSFGFHIGLVHVWGENGLPLANKDIYASWGAWLGRTDPNGFCEITLWQEFDGRDYYNFQIRDGSHQTDTTPNFTLHRPPTWGHYSFEIGFMFKPDVAGPGGFDTNHYGTINASGTDPCLHLSAPYTRSLAYYSTAASNYCSDQYELGNSVPVHGQTFVATGNRVVAVKAFLVDAWNAPPFYWSAQIHEGGPNGPPVGPPRTTRQVAVGEYLPVLAKWGLHDVQVVPGRTYYLRVTGPRNLNLWRVNRNNYASGNYYQNGVSVPGSELMGLVVCGTATNAGPTGTLAGTVRDTSNNPIYGALVTVAGADLYTTTAGNGSYTIPFIPAGACDVSAARAGYVTAVTTGAVISAGQTTTANLALSLQTTNPGDGIITNGASILQPFEAPPRWTSTFHAPWGSPADFYLVSGGQTGQALQGVRGGPGSSIGVQVFPVTPDTPYELSVWMRCAASTSDYWTYCSYRLGRHTAEDFDENSEDWTVVAGFTDNGPNGNGNVWTRYAVELDPGASTEISIGFKISANAFTGTGPIVQWDQLHLKSLLPPVLPRVNSVVAHSPSNILVCFAEPVTEVTATNLANYTVTGAGGGALAVWSATLTDATNLLLVTALQAPRTNYVIAVSNVLTAAHPPGTTGQNIRTYVRVPLTLVPMDPAARWKYDQSGADLGTTWRNPDYDDAAWPEGAAPLADADDPLPEPVRTELTTAPTKTTFYFRRRFVLPGTITMVSLQLKTLLDDGAVFWLNGHELFRLGLAGDPVLFDTPAYRTVEVAAYEGPFSVPTTRLLRGTNLLAVEVHQTAPPDSDVVFGAVLEALVLPSQMPVLPPELGVTHDTNTVILTWTEPGVVLETATNLFGPWTAQTNALSPFPVPPTNGSQYFRLRK